MPGGKAYTTCIILLLCGLVLSGCVESSGQKYILDLKDQNGEDVNFMDIWGEDLFLRGLAYYSDDHAPFVDEHVLVDKEYVDNAVTAINVYYYALDAGSGVADYNLTQIEIPSGAKVSYSQANLNDEDYIRGWISPPDSNITQLIGGLYNFHIHAEKTAGTKTLQLEWGLYERKADDTEVLLATSIVSTEIGAGEEEYDIHLLLGSTHDLNAGSRVVGKIFAVVTGAGNNPTVELYFEGDTASGWGVPSNIEVLQGTFMLRDGSNADAIVDFNQSDIRTLGDLNVGGNAGFAEDVYIDDTISVNYFCSNFGYGCLDFTGTPASFNGDFQVTDDFDVLGDANFTNISTTNLFGTGIVQGSKFTSIASTASGTYSTALGQGTTASGNYSTALGRNTTASALGSFATGYNTDTSDTFEVSNGGVFLTGYTASPVGGASTFTARGMGSVGIGCLFSPAAPYYFESLGSGSIAIGMANAGSIHSTGNGSVAMGYSDANLSATASGAVALGYNVQALAEGAAAIGKDLTNYNENSLLVNDLNALGHAQIGEDLNVTSHYNVDYNGSDVIFSFS